MKYLLVALLFLTACQSQPPLPAWQSPEGRDHPQLGLILDLHTGQQLSPADLLDRLAKTPRILLGEQHDNPDHHALQLWLLKALSERRANGSVLLEMLTPSQQLRVDRLQSATQLPEDLPAALAWQSGWPWQLYGPLVSWLLVQPAPLLSANLDAEEIRDIYAKAPALEGRFSTAESVRQALLSDIRESHCGLLPESQLPAMLAVQQGRDRRMAEALAQAPEPALLIAGGFHVRRDLGVPLHLQDLAIHKDFQVLMLAEVGKRMTLEQADYLWYTPALAPQDYCSSLKKALP